VLLTCVTDEVLQSAVVNQHIALSKVQQCCVLRPVCCMAAVGSSGDKSKHVRVST
jgi:hypothetical protein